MSQVSEQQKVQPLKAPKGVAEYVPPQSSRFLAVRDALTRQAHLAGYQHIELPLFEDTNLFARGVGESTDVVTKEMYTFADRGDRSVTLRPEGTAGVVRAVIEHNLDRGQLPAKLVYSGPFFRYERPQAGRYRMFHSVGVEAIGIDDPTLDAEVIALADRSYRSLGLSGFRLELTSLGDKDCRPQYRAKLQEFLNKLPLDEETRRRAEINPLRVLDDKRPEVREMTADAPLMVDHLSPACQEHFETLTGLLDDMGVAYTLNPRLVRGLDYYTKTCFEFVHDGLGAQSGIGGGGRYDGLLSILGGQDLSGVGFGLGLDRILLALDVEGVDFGTDRRVDIYGVALGSEAKQKMALIINQLRRTGISADMSYGDRGLKGAMKGADRAHARYALVMGETELASSSVAIKDMASHEQHTIALHHLVTHIRNLLK